ncbi:MAG: cold shock domain-containing protein [Nitrosarchaeum sp.]|nr:cold shock domain-containing protein [Nitrosarchaeum sp.]
MSEMKGKVKFFNQSKGYGFVACEDDGKEYFVHFSAVQGNAKLTENARVTFDVEDSDRGPRAVRVKVEAGGSATKEHAEADDDYAEDEDVSEEDDDKY